MSELLMSRTALATAGDSGLRRIEHADTVVLSEQAPGGALALRLDPRDAATAQLAAGCLGVSLPAPNTWRANGGVAVLWQACDEWLVMSAAEAADELRNRMASALHGRHATLVDVSDMQAVFGIAGPNGRDLLRKGCAVDLHPRQFSTGGLARTALARTCVSLWQISEVPEYRVAVERTYAHYLWDWLADAALEFAAVQ